jgi:hypothetical protein
LGARGSARYKSSLWMIARSSPAKPVRSPVATIPQANLRIPWWWCKNRAFSPATRQSRTEADSQIEPNKVAGSWRKAVTQIGQGRHLALSPPLHEGPLPRPSPPTPDGHGQLIAHGWVHGMKIAAAPRAMASRSRRIRGTIDASEPTVNVSRK